MLCKSENWNESFRKFDCEQSFAIEAYQLKVWQKLIGSNLWLEKVREKTTISFQTLSKLFLLLSEGANLPPAPKVGLIILLKI